MFRDPAMRGINLSQKTKKFFFRRLNYNVGIGIYNLFLYFIFVVMAFCKFFSLLTFVVFITLSLITNIIMQLLHMHFMLKLRQIPSSPSLIFKILCLPIPHLSLIICLQNTWLVQFFTPFSGPYFHHFGRNLQNLRRPRVYINQ